MIWGYILLNPYCRWFQKFLIVSIVFEVFPSWHFFFFFSILTFLLMIRRAGICGKRGAKVKGVKELQCLTKLGVIVKGNWGCDRPCHDPSDSQFSESWLVSKYLGHSSCGLERANHPMVCEVGRTSSYLEESSPGHCHLPHPPRKKVAGREDTGSG